jgi:23S rRNA (adenine(2503)-C(2))-methyltransferase
MIYFQSLNQTELAELLLPFSRKGDPLKDRKTAKYRAQQIFHWVYQRYVFEWDQMTDVSKELREWLKGNVEIFRLQSSYDKQALDGTHKFLWKLDDGKTIESVIIPAALQEKDADEADEILAGGARSADPRASNGGVTSVTRVSPMRTPGRGEPGGYEEGKRFAGRETSAAVDSGKWSRLTACISSQVGCAMACKFCLTGIQGLDRHLKTHEIVSQVLELRKIAPLTNIVFMGMGEPLHNFDNVVKACEILLDTDGMNFSKRKVTVSTSGLVPKIIELGKRVDVSLAISLNSSTDEQRDSLMPVNQRWNIEALMDACRQFPTSNHRRITFEYVMIAGFNDSLEDAARVNRLVRGIPCKVNLIPFNEHPGAPGMKRPSDATVRAFQNYLMERKLVTTVRISRGRDILAACGQLRSIFGTARGTEKHKDYVATADAPASASP